MKHLARALAFVLALLPAIAAAQTFPTVPSGTVIGRTTIGSGPSQAIPFATLFSAGGIGTMAFQNANAVAITGGTITGLPAPSAASDAATKSYVDAVAGINVLATSTLATAAVLPNTPTYANGASGVGATLTAGSNTTLTVDGTAAPLSTVVLVKNQASALQNGIYTVTAAGSGGAPWVLTRATYFDTAAEMMAGAYTFVTGGATNIGSAFMLSANVTTVGTTSATFSTFSQATGNVMGPVSATDNAAARYDATTGKLIQNSALLIADTTGALSRSGGGGIAVEGSAGVASAAGYIGETKSSVKAIGAGTALVNNTDVVWNTLSITAGCWMVGGNAGVIKTGGTTPTFSHMHSDHNITGATVIQTSPGNGSTVAMHLTSNDPNGWIVSMGWIPYCVAVTTTVRAVMLTNFTGGTGEGYGVLWAVRIN